MATAELRLRALDAGRNGARQIDDSRLPAALRLFHAERSDEIYPILLEEIVKLGYPRALVLAANFETGELAPVAALRCNDEYIEKFRTSIYNTDHPIAGIFHSFKSTVLPKSRFSAKPLFVQPLLFRNSSVCWEAERSRRTDCLATENYRHERRLILEDQVCKTCEMRSYAALVVVELNRRPAAAEVSELNSLAELANRYLARLFKLEHYYHRMREMDTTIAQMETVMKSMADPVILTDPQHRVIMQNQAAARFFRLPEETTEGLVRAVELNNMLFSAMLSSMAMSGGEMHRDLTLVDAMEGEELLFEAVCAPSFGSDGNQIGMVTVMRDVTDLRRADQELQFNYEKLRNAEDVVRQDRDRLNLIIENVGDPIVVCDSDAKPVLLDPLAQRLFASADISDPIRVKNTAVLDAYIYGFTFSFANAESQTLRFVDPETRSDIEFDARSGKIYDERGQVAYTVTVLRDYSAVRKLEQLKLERRILEMEKFAATGQLAATIAHEVNNPMEAIKNAIYLLAGRVQPEAAPVYEILKGETERVARIVRQMLGLYRNNEAVKPIDVNMLLEDTLLLLNRQLQRTNVVVETRLEQLPLAVVSSDQLRQVFSNMVINARDSMPNGGRLIVRTRHVPSPDGLHGMVRITIADTGTGIPREMIDSIFEPFVTTKGEKGTGLGLWIVKGIISNHRGKLAVRSKPGQGTVFKIELPVVR